MTDCEKNGAQTGPEEKNCPDCCAPDQEKQEGVMNDIADKAKEVLNTEDTTSEYDPQDIQSSRGLAWLSYCGPLVFIPMFVKKDSKFTQFHVRQGVTLLALYIAYTIVSFLIGLIRVRSVWGYSYTPWFVYLLQFLLYVPVAVLTVIGIINAATGKAKKLPLIGNIDVLGWFVKK